MTDNYTELSLYLEQKIVCWPQPTVLLSLDKWITSWMVDTTTSLIVGQHALGWPNINCTVIVGTLSCRAEIQHNAYVCIYVCVLG